jgi:C1A family cysteine protease
MNMATETSSRICNLLPSKKTETDWGLEHAVQSGAITAPPALPPSVDLRQAWWAIGNQENTGSCVGWASTDGVMRYHMHKAGKLSDRELLSVRYTWMASKETDTDVAHATTFIEEAGTYLKTAMDACRRWGVVPEKLLPFHISTLMFTGHEVNFYAVAAQRRVAAYYNLGKDPNQWRTWLASHGPILAGLSVDATWDNATATHGMLDTFQPNTVRGGHAVCIVGYTAEKRFIVRNSWGPTWGDKGFGYASEAYIKGAFFPESYGITV